MAETIAARVGAIAVAGAVPPRAPRPADDRGGPLYLTTAAARAQSPDPLWSPPEQDRRALPGAVPGHRCTTAGQLPARLDDLATTPAAQPKRSPSCSPTTTRSSARVCACWSTPSRACGSWPRRGRSGRAAYGQRPPPVRARARPQHAGRLEPRGDPHDPRAGAEHRDRGAHHAERPVVRAAGAPGGRARLRAQGGGRRRAARRHPPRRRRRDLSEPSARGAARGPAVRADGTARRSLRARGRGSEADRTRPHERRDRRPALPQRAHRRVAPRPHPAQDAPVLARRARPLRARASASSSSSTLDSAAEPSSSRSRSTGWASGRRDRRYAASSRPIRYGAR